ncbi:beta-lactamase family protein [Aquimarina sp. TRL1]|uniref:serine hydrolase domain-containing protein n=1 Tax=Aquimarina sp. (strain TRL1) TaxID=2736252 RepID=UPI00158D5336|nr:serine hydrolase domain-containing protein [Aquimarina sp. TRL1]QKX06188.1 beta-lactamase family protein [Aquimarina sp. TRL1]
MKKIFLFVLAFAHSYSYTQNQNLDSLLSNYEKENNTMGAVSILKDGKEFFSKAIGYSSIELDKKNNAETKFRIGSISKTFTATIILQLVDEGKLSLDNSLNKYFSEIPNSERITIADMLYHRSGIYNITTEKNFEVWISKPRNRKEILTKIKEYKSSFDPNSKTQYSNSNYVLLAYIAEDIDKQTFGEIIQKRIVNKLNLKNTSFGKDIDLSKNEAMCYYLENSIWYPIAFHTNLTGTMGAGGIISNATDVSIFYNALFTGKLLSDESLQLMTTPKEGMGMGISVDNFNGITVYGHDGAIDGFRSMAVYIPKFKSTIALTLNASYGPTGKKLIPIVQLYLKTINQK